MSSPRLGGRTCDRDYETGRMTGIALQLRGSEAASASEGPSPTEN
jgi:hypothetical protein